MRKRKLENRITTFSIGSHVEDDCGKVVNHFLNHFKRFMGSRSSVIDEIDLDCIQYGNLLNLEQQVNLIRPFTRKDVKKALFSIHSTKSPGLDGYGSGFFKALWNQIGGEVSSAILGFFRMGSYLPSLMKQLSDVLPMLVHSNQGAFVKNKLLAHNVLIFQDLLQGYNRKNISARCIMKIDLSKAYDTVDWNFLENLLKQLCFPSIFIHWVMVCLRGTKYNLLTNGRIQGSFKGEKGLRQGDLISPLLFVLIMDYLTRLLAQYSKNKGFSFHPHCKQLGLINLCFANDLLTFCKGNISSVKGVQEAFIKFSDSSSLSINNTKSHIYFGGVKEESKIQILKLVQMQEGSFPLKYLGVHLRPTRCKASDCGVILDSLNRKLNGLASRNLSFVGRAQLIHSFLLGIRNFWMSLFILPKKVTLAINKCCRDFLWGVKGNKSKLHLPSWEKTCLPKKLGGIGFYEGKKWNMAMMAKFIWAISWKKDCLWVRWVSTIYLKKFSIWNVPKNQNMSWYFKKILKIRDHTREVELLNCVKHEKFRAKLFYASLVDNQEVWYAKAIWDRLIIPKHRFIYWQACNLQLLTGDNLESIFPIQSNLCPVCDQEKETHNHLFMDCHFTKLVLQDVSKWFGAFNWPRNIIELQDWVQNAAFDLKFQIYNAILAGILYWIWKNSNSCVFNLLCYSSTFISRDVKRFVKYRVLGFACKHTNTNDRIMDVISS
ncbi:uncharacterized protein LOC133038329 [Cannabis sativa]|uniref:uncharacterized protein LOC133038329 n=1 Tax=Cannabis sativa TaxID=3483 RepID=UPI0029CA7C91|nr:uncharacterized protein LOC133038329 [Cannabis sativa]